MTQQEKILELLEKHPKGVTNFDLNKIAFRYSARIKDLREQGYDISATHIKGSEWSFRLEPSMCPVCQHKTLHKSIGVCDWCDKNAKWGNLYKQQRSMF